MEDAAPYWRRVGTPSCSSDLRLLSSISLTASTVPQSNAASVATTTFGGCLGPFDDSADVDGDTPGPDDGRSSAGTDADGGGRAGAAGHVCGASLDVNVGADDDDDGIDLDDEERDTFGSSSNCPSAAAEGAMRRTANLDRYSSGRTQSTSVSGYSKLLSSRVSSAGLSLGHTHSVATSAGGVSLAATSGSVMTLDSGLRRHGLSDWLARFRDGEVDEGLGLGIDCPATRAAILAALPDFDAAAPAAGAAAAGLAVGGLDSPGPLLVDYFSPASRAIPAALAPYRILTHFHADHYKGLTKSFSGGVVLASPVTARLVAERLRLPAARLRTLPMDTPVTVDGVTLTLVDANHCPGAAMFIAEVLPPPPPTQQMQQQQQAGAAGHVKQHPALQALVGRRCTLVLDTTYADPAYVFPPQQDVLDAVLTAVRAEAFNKRVGDRAGVGAEARDAGCRLCAVYCSKEKAATLSACGLAPRYSSLITTNHLEANIHAVPLFKVTLDGLAAILSQYRGRYSAVIGFSVPYSEHSSFSELRSFVRWLQPGRIIPSVNADG
eukprot:XP_001695097.1 predicted protein [Chlamydomonas reinhardtii]